MSRNDAAVVLMYHRVSDPSRDPFWLSASPENFAQHLSAVVEIADVVPLRSIFDGGRRVAITFDDGYRDNLDVAYPLLSEARLPATVFVSSDVMSTTTAFWWDRLEHLLLDEQPRRPVVELDAGGSRVRLDLRDSEGRQHALAVVQAHTRARPVAEIEEILDGVADQLDDQHAEGACPPLLDEVGVRELARDGLVEIGGHARSHSMLSGLSAAQQWSEIAGCKEALERVVERPVTTFAYPFGDRRAFTSRTVSLVKKAGFELACTTKPGRVTRSTRRYRVPRLAVRNWDHDEFTREVMRALDGDS